jgi:predicted lipoprotein with Yx(FWY)xxD motif
MTRHKPLSVLTAFVAFALIALVVSACGGGGNQATAASSNANKGPTVSLSQAGSLGKILVDAQGRTLYRFQKDTGTMSTCSGACAAEWPPATTNGKPSAGGGLTASKLGTTKRSDGTTQVTYNGHPLYRFSGDQSAGDTNGQGINAFGARWYVVSAAGNAVTTMSSSSSGGSGY